jgi:predicted RNA methylase
MVVNSGLMLADMVSGDTIAEVLAAMVDTAVIDSDFVVVLRSIITA